MQLELTDRERKLLFVSVTFLQVKASPPASPMQQFLEDLLKIQGWHEPPWDEIEVLRQKLRTAEGR